MNPSFDSFVVDRLPPRSQWPRFSNDAVIPDGQQTLNLVDALFDRAFAAGHADRPMLRAPGRTLTYRQASEEVNRIAELLSVDLGLVPGNRVLLRGGNSIAMALGWLGAVKAGMVALATMPLLRARELGDILEKAQPSAALCDARLLDELKAACATPAGASVREIVAFNAPTDAASMEARAAGKSGQFVPAYASKADDIALMAFTSGTTGKPKAPVHSHRNVLAACTAWPDHVLKLGPGDVVIGSPPLAFTFGLGGVLLFPMWAGASVWLPDSGYTPESMVRTIREQGVTVCFTAPTFYRQMAPIAKAEGVPTLRKTVSAGEGLPDATRQLWKDATGIEMIDGIGATEMFHIFISSAGSEVRRGAIGKVVPGYTARVVDADGQEVPRGTVGKLAVHGPTGCRYLDDERQLKYVKDGWNFPGDAFMQDEDGYFFYQARDDDMIITAGYNVGGPEVEDALLRHPAVAECGVVGAPDELRGMIVQAWCVLKPGQVGDAAMVKTLQEHVKASIAPYKYPRSIMFVEALPRTETGKLQRFRLRELQGR
ncbi:AMP-binding protein [Variovorax dokdonensis]|uniref:AMP-binding protein n=1 Tax=Variovorax dokdonensis TaxID=344883 RepID=A0ABT7NGG4_9BURK|nr:AMP-binding protein [Variovorax dokdonensis]MDM0047022.1 AMP-binding protein [Variovorax dokdonensis]